MTDVVPTSANEFVRHQLNTRLEALEDAFDADGLCIVGPLGNRLDDSIRLLVEGLRKESPRRRLAVILTTNGGYVEVVHRIIDTMRRHYDHVTFIVPNYAFSAGTVLALSGDEIFMDYYSRLGPIDPQVHSNRVGKFVPALGYLRRYDDLIKKANDGTITTAELQVMLFGFDQAELYQYDQTRQLTISLLKDWLVKYKFKDWTRTETRGRPVTTAMKKMRAAAIARQLNNTDKWHVHGYGISMEVLRKELNLKIDDLDSDPRCADSIKQYGALLFDYMDTIGVAAMLHTRLKYEAYIGSASD